MATTYADAWAVIVAELLNIPGRAHRLPTDADPHAVPAARRVRRCARCDRLTFAELCGRHLAEIDPGPTGPPCTRVVCGAPLTC